MGMFKALLNRLRMYNVKGFIFSFVQLKKKFNLKIELFYKRFTNGRKFSLKVACSVAYANVGEFHN